MIYCCHHSVAQSQLGSIVVIFFIIFEIFSVPTVAVTADVGWVIIVIYRKNSIIKVDKKQLN